MRGRIKQQLQQQLDSLDVHQCRKVAKVCEAWARLGAHKALAKGAKGLRKDLGAQRDAWVRYQWRLKLGQKAKAPPMGPAPKVEALKAAIRVAPLPDESQLLLGFCRRYGKARRHYLVLKSCKHPRPEALHRLRKEVKALAVYSQWLGAKALAAAFKTLGDRLGDDHDLAVLGGQKAKDRRRQQHRQLRVLLRACFGKKSLRNCDLGSAVPL